VSDSPSASDSSGDDSDASDDAHDHGDSDASDDVHDHGDSDASDDAHDHGDSDASDDVHDHGATASDGGEPAVGGVSEIDWEAADPSWSVPIARLTLAAVAFVALAAAWLNVQATNVDPLLDRNPQPLVWPFRVAVVVAVVGFLPAVFRRRDRARRLLGRLRRDWTTRLATAYLAVATLVAVVGPALTGLPDVVITASTQPPVGVEVAYPTTTDDCLATVRETATGRVCPGTLQYPLGTTELGYDVVTLVVNSLRTSLQVVVVTLALAIPLGTLVGSLAGVVGGRVDDVLSWYVDVQQTLPTFVVYLLAVFVFGEGLVLFVLVFGLLGWSSTAKLVRGAVVQRREAAFVRAARAAGASRLAVLRRHVLPNVLGTVVVEATRRAPQLILLEVGVTFVGLGDTARRVPSFGNVIRAGVDQQWWVLATALAVLAAAVGSLLIVGDALGEGADARPG
jgi:peptide/nickel transport system permease protein